MSSYIFLKIVTPFKNEFKGEVKYLEIPSLTGKIGILPGHMSVISAMKEGIIKITLPNNEKLSFETVGGGFLKFNKNIGIITIKSIKLLEQSA